MIKKELERIINRYVVLKVVSLLMLWKNAYELGAKYLAGNSVGVAFEIAMTLLWGYMFIHVIRKENEARDLKNKVK